MSSLSALPISILARYVVTADLTTELRSSSIFLTLLLHQIQQNIKTIRYISRVESIEMVVGIQLALRASNGVFPQTTTRPPVLVSSFGGNKGE